MGSADSSLLADVRVKKRIGHVGFQYAQSFVLTGDKLLPGVFPSDELSVHVYRGAVRNGC